MFKPSKYQQGVFDFITQGRGHGVVKACPGSGKTTTARQALPLINFMDSVLFCAFNKSIADELSKNIPGNVQAMTLHSLGCSAFRNNGIKWKLDKFKNSNIYQSSFDPNSRSETGEYYKSRAVVSKLVGLLKGHLIMNPYPDDVLGLAEHYGIELSSSKIVDSVIQVFNIGKEITKTIDFDDMIFLPVYKKMEVQKFDWVFIDEFQDLNDAQQELAMMAGGQGRIIAIGDEHQSIYGFRGANVEAMKNFEIRMEAVALPLSICYRCSKEVINEASKIYPDIEPSDSAPQGSVSTIKKDEFLITVKEGDFVLCRITAPLVSQCLKFIREGKKAVVRGRDIGESLISLLEKISQEGFASQGKLGLGNSFVDKVSSYRIEAVAKLERGRDKEDEIIALNDRIDTILALYEGLDAEDGDPVQGIKSRIDTIFSDQIEGIVFSTIHKAKGLESENVFILAPEKLPHPMAKKDWQKTQEMNLKFVAITRAKLNLYYIKG